LTEDQAQKVLDYVSDRLNGADNATAERLLDGFVDRRHGLNDVANVERLIEEGDENALPRDSSDAGGKACSLSVSTITTIGRQAARAGD